MVGVDGSEFADKAFRVARALMKPKDHLFILTGFFVVVVVVVCCCVCVYVYVCLHGFVFALCMYVCVYVCVLQFRRYFISSQVWATKYTTLWSQSKALRSPNCSRSMKTNVKI